jgi:hypothetical protein
MIWPYIYFHIWVKWHFSHITGEHSCFNLLIMNCLYNVLIPRDTSHAMLPYNCLCYLLLLLSIGKNSSEQFRNHVGNTTARTVRKSCRKYYTVRTIRKSCRKYYTVRTVQKSFRKYYTVRTIQKSCRKIPHCQNSSEIMSMNITLSEQFRNHVGYTTLSEQFQNHVEKYHTVRTVPKSCRKTCRKIQHC